MSNKSVSQYFTSMQPQLFPDFSKDLGITTKKHLKVIVALDMIELETHLPYEPKYSVGRPKANRSAIARSFIAKSVLNIPTTVGLIDRLQCDLALRRICGFEVKIPSEGTFSNAFKEFSEMNLASIAHENLIKESFEDKLVVNVSRDSTPITGREKVNTKPAKEKSTKKRKKGRPKKGEKFPVKTPSMLETQSKSDLDTILKNLPTGCDITGKKNSKGNIAYTIGYKLHLDVDDYGIPLTALVTSASTHDSQVAIPLERLTNDRVSSLYSLMDAAYNSDFIVNEVESSGKVAIIDPKKPRGGEKTPLTPTKQDRYKARSTVERTNATLKDDFGARYVRVKGHIKVTSHLMFGVVAMAALRIVDISLFL